MKIDQRKQIITDFEGKVKRCLVEGFAELAATGLVSVEFDSQLFPVLILNLIDLPESTFSKQILFIELFLDLLKFFSSIVKVVLLKLYSIVTDKI